MNTIRIASILALSTLSACASAPSSLDETQPLSPDDVTTSLDYADQADAVFVGQVQAIDYQLAEPNTSGYAIPFTYVTWSIEDGIKGVDDGATYTARFIGGPEANGVWMEVTEVPQFAVGDRDLLFIAGNGEVGCPLVAGALGRVRLDGSQDGLSPSASTQDWAPRIASQLREGGVEHGDSAPSVRFGERFEFAWPAPATQDELLENIQSSRATSAPAPVESSEWRAERLAVEAGDGNPVLP